jgi:hypothetical protein
VSINSQGCTIGGGRTEKEPVFEQTSHKQKFSQSELIPAESLQINIAFPVFRYDPKKPDSQSIIQPSAMFSMQNNSISKFKPLNIKYSQLTTPQASISLKPKLGFGHKKKSSEVASSTGDLRKFKFSI